MYTACHDIQICTVKSANHYLQFDVTRTDPASVMRYNFRVLMTHATVEVCEIRSTHLVLVLLRCGGILVDGRRAKGEKDTDMQTNDTSAARGG